MKITAKNLIKNGWGCCLGVYEKFNAKNTVSVQVYTSEDGLVLCTQLVRLNPNSQDWVVCMPRPTVHCMKDLEYLCKLYLQDKVI